MKTRARGTKARLLVVLGLLFVAVLVTVVLQKKQETAGDQNLRMTLVIDPGHGGIDSGAVGADGTRESDINLAIGLKLRALAELYGQDNALIRQDDSTKCDTEDYSEHRDLVCRTELTQAEQNTQVSEMIRQVLIREGLDGHTVPSFRRNSLAESQRSRIRDEVLRKGYITRAVAQQVLGVCAKVASTRLTELVENGDLARTGRSFVPAGLGVASEKWEEIVMELAERRGEIRIVEVAYLLHISKSTARRYLLKMAEEGTLLYERERRRFRLPLEAEGVRERRQENEID